MRKSETLTLEAGNRRRIAKKVGMFVVMCIVAIVQLYPIIWLFLFSLKDNAQIYGGNIAGFPNPIVWQNYADVWLNSSIPQGLWNSIKVTGVTILLSGILSCMCTYGLVRLKWRLRKATMQVLITGMMIPVHACLLPLLLTMKSIGLTGTHWALIIPYTAFAIPTAVFILSGFFESLPRDLEAAAFIDGCNVYQSFVRIILPLVKPAIAAASIFTFLAVWNDLMLAITFVNEEALKTLTYATLGLQGMYSTQWGPVGAGLMIATIPTLVLYISLSRQIQSGLIMGSIKG